MTDVSLATRAQFAKAVTRLIDDAIAQNREDDLHRLVRHLERTPSDVSRLASLLLLVDDDVRPALKTQIDAYRRLETQKGRDASDDAILSVLRDVYAAFASKGESGAPA